MSIVLWSGCRAWFVINLISSLVHLKYIHVLFILNEVDYTRFTVNVPPFIHWAKFFWSGEWLFFWDPMSDLDKIRLSCNAVAVSCNIRTIPNTGLGSNGRRNKSCCYEMDSLCVKPSTTMAYIFQYFLHVCGLWMLGPVEDLSWVFTP